MSTSLPLLATCLALAAACAAPPGTTGPLLDDPGQAWLVATTNGVDGRDGTWLRDDEGVLTLTDAAGHSDQEYNLTWRPDVRLADVDLSVRVRAVAGEEDRGGGPTWRVAGPDDYYVARWNPLEHNYRVYEVVDGYRHELGSATVYVEPAGWHTLRVRMVGERITCWLDGHPQLEVESDSLPAAGGVGLWTKADATTRFADLVVAPAD